MRDHTMRRLPRRLGRGLAGALGFDLIKRHYYSAIPDLRTLTDADWTRESPMHGVAFDIPAGLEFLRTELAGALAEYTPPRLSTGAPRDFFLDNSLYESVDAETLYAVVRRFAPSRVLELGSGFSSLVIMDARAAGGQDDRDGHVVYDPYPRSDLEPVIRNGADLRATPATQIPLRDFAQLQDGDLLFVDTTHTVKMGSDVNALILDVLPILAPGVIVHFHDIFLPWEYPREFLTERHFFWAEQYLLQAFLAMNPSYEVLFSNYALHRRFPRELADLIPSARGGARPAGFWMRRTHA